MPLTFAGTLDRSAVTDTVDQLTDLVGSAEVADAWDRESALPGMTVGGLARHLVSQPERSSSSPLQARPTPRC